jgi:hypothetical protein
MKIEVDLDDLKETIALLRAALECPVEYLEQGAWTRAMWAVNRLEKYTKDNK